LAAAKMGTWRSSQRSDPITKARLLRERAAECRVMAKDARIGESIREGYLELARAYDALAHQNEAIVAEKRAWELSCTFSYSDNPGPSWRTGSRVH
jgi:hypothetical protein